MMPAHFGGNSFDTSYKAQQKATTLAVTFETDRAELERYIPEELELRAPDVQVALNQLTEINWLGGEVQPGTGLSPGTVQREEGSR